MPVPPDYMIYGPGPDPALDEIAPIPLSEQIAAVERAYTDVQRNMVGRWPDDIRDEMHHADRLAAALATLRGLLLIEETR